MTGAGAEQSDSQFSRRAALGTLAAAAGTAALAPFRSQARRLNPFGTHHGADVGQPAQRLSAAEPTRRWYETTIGESVEGRPIIARHSIALTEERHRVVVVGTIHGDEQKSQPTVEAMSNAPVPDDITFSIIPTLNPDGRAAGTRLNANEIDLNRNFPFGWRRSNLHGLSPNSEPETQAITKFIADGNFDLAIWVHQPLGYIAPIGKCPGAYADAWQDQVSEQRRDGVTQIGGGETWCAYHLRISSMLIEIDGWDPSPEAIDAHVRGFVECMKAVSASR